jgi:hypothetical protein
MFKLIGNRHAYVSNSIDSIDILSYISIIAFVRITEGLFSQKCELGGNLYAHIKPSQVIYYFGTNSNFNCYNSGDFAGILSVSQDSLNIYNFFAQKENLTKLINIVKN